MDLVRTAHPTADILCRVRHAHRNYQQKGYVLLPVVVALILIATVAFLINTESAVNLDMTAGEMEGAQAEYVAQAGMAHVTWGAQNSGCVGDMTMTTVPFGQGSYTATVDAGGSTTTSYSFTPDRDTWIKEASPDENNAGGSLLSVKIKPGDSFRALYHYDLSSIPNNKKVVTATAWFYLNQNDNQGAVTLHPLTTSWTETGATWNTIGSNFESSIYGSISPQPASGVWISVNLTALAQAWVNNPSTNFGILLNATVSDLESRFTSKESGASQRPYLEVTTADGDVSPVQISATGTTAGGVTRTLSRSAVRAYQPSSTLALQPGTEGTDAEIWDQAPDNNYGDADETWVSSASNDTTRSLLSFNMGAIPAGARILGATLSLRRRSGSGADQPVSAHRILNPWSEDSVTWNRRETGTNWDTAGGDFDNTAVATTPVGPVNQRYEWNITPLVQGWVDSSYPNYGVILVAAIAGMPGERFDTSDHTDPSRWPSLTTTYACECGSPCVTPQGSGRIAMIAKSSGLLPDPLDKAKETMLESWGYDVDMYDDNFLWLFNSSSYDAIYISATASDSTLVDQLKYEPIGIVYELEAQNNDIGMASGDASTVGTAITITDSSHYITLPFPAGPLSIKTAATRLSTISGTAAAGAQVLAQTGGLGSLLTLDTGAALGGTGVGEFATARRVMLPVGMSTTDGWSHLNNNGLLIVQRALQWASGNLGPIVSVPIILSTDSPATLGGLGFDDIDLAEYDPLGDFATLFFEGAPTTLTIDIDALHVLENGHIVLSTKAAATLGGLSFKDGDLVDYDPAADTAVLYFDESAFGADEDIISVYLMDNGHILLSTDSDASLGGLNFTDNDLVEYDPGSGTATLYFDGSTTTLTSDIDALHVLENGHIVLSTKDDATLGGLSFKDGDLVDYDPATDTAVLYFAEALFAANEDVISAHIGPGSGGDSATGPIAHWKLDETSGTTAVDSEGGHDGTLAGNPSWSTGTLEGALDFDGAGDRIDVGPVLNTGAPQISVTAWVFKRDTGDDRVISKSSGTAIPDHIFSLGLAGTTIRVRLRTTDNGGTSNYDGGTISLNQWVHLAFTYDGGTLRIYKNGTQTASHAVTGDMIASALGVSIGNVNATDDRYWNGLLDDVRIYDRVLDAAEIVDVAGSGGGGGGTGPIAYWMLDETSGTTAMDSEGEHDGTLAGNPTWSTGILGGALDFDGGGDRIDAGPILDGGASQISVTAWVFKRDTGDDWVISKSSGGAIADHIFSLGLANTTIRVRLRTTDNGGTSNYDGGTISLNQWVHLAFTYDGGTLRIYKNGTQTASHAVTGDMIASALGVSIGNVNATDDRYWNGLLDDVRIYDRALDVAEIVDVAAGGGSCNGTYRDEFNIRQYDQNDGTLTWETDWEETGESTDPTGGDIQITADVSNYQLRVRDDGQTVSREADLSDAGSATLSFDYRRENLSGTGDYVAVEVSFNGGTSWTELERFTGTADDESYTSSSYVLDAGSLSANTRIRFLTPNSGMNNNNMVWFDNIQIECSP